MTHLISSMADWFRSLSDSSVRLLAKDIGPKNSRSARRREAQRRLAANAEQPRSSSVGEKGKSAVTSAAGFVLEGEISRGQSTTYSVNGKDIVVDTETWIFGEVELGARVSVHCSRRAGNEIYARKILIAR